MKFVTTVLNSPVSTTELGRITSTKQNQSSPGTRQSDIRQMRGEMTSFLICIHSLASLVSRFDTFFPNRSVGESPD